MISNPLIFPLFFIKSFRNFLNSVIDRALALVKNVDLTGKTLDDKVETSIEIEITKSNQEKVRAERTLFL